MSRQCKNPACFVHDGEACALGKLSFYECKSWGNDLEGAPQETCVASTIDHRVLWSSSALGITDLANLASRRKPVLIGVLGAHDAGKTTFLTASYLNILRGKRIAGGTFSGSYTLGAWESLAAWARFEDAARTPSFPPHTPRGTSRVPGLLHLSICRAKKEFEDVLFTDAPGEWFTRWAVQEDASDAQGALWVSHKSDAFLVFADCQRLAGSGRGSARNDLRQLIERLGKHVRHRPTIFVWAKNDCQVGDGIKNAIRRTLYEYIPHAVEVNTTTAEPESISSALDMVLEAAWNLPYAKFIREPVVAEGSFEAFRGHDAEF